MSFDETCAIMPADYKLNGKNTRNQRMLKTTAYKTTLSDNYSINSVPNGGYIAALAVNAAKAALHSSTDTGTDAFPNCLSISGPFHAATTHLQEAEISTEVLHIGRSNASVAVKLSQEGTIRCSFTVLLGNLSTMKGIDVQSIHPPLLPPRGECIKASEMIRKALGNGFRVADHVDMLIPSNDPFALSTLSTLTGHPATHSHCSISGYMRFRNGALPNLEFFSDIAPPPTLNHMITQWVPTLEYSVHMFADPQDIGTWSSSPDTDTDTDTDTGMSGNSNWVRFMFNSVYVHNGLVSTDGELWTDEPIPRLLARSRQMARHLLPRAPKKT